MENRSLGIREISRKEYDLLVAEQQAFFDNLIKEGRARIVDSEKPHPPPNVPAAPQPTAPKPPQKKLPRPDILRPLKGRRVRAVALNGAEIEGLLEEVWQYEIVIDGVILFKHALFSVRRL